MTASQKTRQRANFNRASHKSLKKNPVYIQQLYNNVKQHIDGIQYSFFRAPKVKFVLVLPKYLKLHQLAFRDDSIPVSHKTKLCLQLFELSQYYGKVFIALNFVRNTYQRLTNNYGPRDHKQQQGKYEKILSTAADKMILQVVRQICRHGAYYPIHRLDFLKFCDDIIELTGFQSSLPEEILWTLLRFCAPDHTIAKVENYPIYRTIVMYTFATLFVTVVEHGARKPIDGHKMLQYCYRHNLVRLYMFVNLFVNNLKTDGLLTLKDLYLYPIAEAMLPHYFNQALHTVWYYILEDRHYPRRCWGTGCLTWKSLCALTRTPQPQSLTELCARTLLRAQNRHRACLETFMAKFAVDGRIHLQEQIETHSSSTLARSMLEMFDHDITLAIRFRKKSETNPYMRKHWRIHKYKCRRRLWDIDSDFFEDD